MANKKTPYIICEDTSSQEQACRRYARVLDRRGDVAISEGTLV